MTITTPQAQTHAIIVAVLLLAASSGVHSIDLGGRAADIPVSGGTPPHIDDLGNTPEVNVSVRMNCTQRRVTVTAPASYQYRLTVAGVNVTPTTSRATRRGIGPITGNQTHRLPPAGVVGVFVVNTSRGAAVARAVTVCGPPGIPTRSETTTGAVPHIQVNCTTGVVRFTPAEPSTVASVTVVTLTPTQTATSRLTQTLHGNETMQVQTHGVIAGFLSPNTLGDAETVGVVRDCGAPARNTSTRAL